MDFAGKIQPESRCRLSRWSRRLIDGAAIEFDVASNVYAAFDLHSIWSLSASHIVRPPRPMQREQKEEEHGAVTSARFGRVSLRSALLFPAGLRKDPHGDNHEYGREEDEVSELRSDW
jgi:hypothetical protein